VADAAYIYFTEEPLMPGRDSVLCETPVDAAWVVMDWKDGKIVGLEVLDASRLLHADLLAQARVSGSMALEDRQVDFGCEYCADDQIRLCGHLPQIASDESREMILLRCPRCGVLYENTPRRHDNTRRLSPSEADRLYPNR